jgi:hypothetical protein
MCSLRRDGQTGGLVATVEFLHRFQGDRIQHKDTTELRPRQQITVRIVPSPFTDKEKLSPGVRDDRIDIAAHPSGRDRSGRCRINRRDSSVVHVAVKHSVRPGVPDDVARRPQGRAKAVNHLTGFGVYPQDLTGRKDADPQKATVIVKQQPPGLTVHRDSPKDPAVLSVKFTNRPVVPVGYPHRIPAFRPDHDLRPSSSRRVDTQPFPGGYPKTVNPGGGHLGDPQFIPVSNYQGLHKAFFPGPLLRRRPPAGRYYRFVSPPVGLDPKDIYPGTTKKGHRHGMGVQKDDALGRTSGRPFRNQP